jgi:hypothetical protein
MRVAKESQDYDLSVATKHAGPTKTNSLYRAISHKRSLPRSRIVLIGRDTGPIRNRLLAALPDDEYKRLQPHFELVQLSTRKVLCEAGYFIGYAYFLTVAWGLCLPLLKAVALWKSQWWATKGC